MPAVKLQESDVLHLGRRIDEWRLIVGCVRNTAKVSGHQRLLLMRIADELEGHLPKLSREDSAT